MSKPKITDQPVQNKHRPVKTIRSKQFQNRRLDLTINPCYSMHIT